MGGIPEGWVNVTTGLPAVTGLPRQGWSAGFGRNAIGYISYLGLAGLRKVGKMGKNLPGQSKDRQKDR